MPRTVEEWLPVVRAKGADDLAEILLGELVGYGYGTGTAFARDRHNDIVALIGLFTAIRLDEIHGLAGAGRAA